VGRGLLAGNFACGSNLRRWIPSVRHGARYFRAGRRRDAEPSRWAGRGTGPGQGPHGPLRTGQVTTLSIPLQAGINGASDAAWWRETGRIQSGKEFILAAESLT
jgi:hypothetical protein